MIAYITRLSATKFYEDKMDQVKGLRLDFSSKLRSLPDSATLVQKFINGGAMLEELTISNAPRLTYLPTELTNCPIKSLTVANCKNFAPLTTIAKEFNQLEYLNLSGKKLVIGAGFPVLPNLETLILDYEVYESDNGIFIEKFPSLTCLIIKGQAINIGTSFKKFPNLKELTIACSSINTLDGIGTCEKLEKLILKSFDAIKFSDKISDLSNLKILEIANLSKLLILPTLENCTNLTKLSLTSLGLEEFSIDFSKLQALEQIHFNHINKEGTVLTLPDNFGNCINLRKLYLGGCNFKALPESINQFANLEELELYRQEYSHLPNAFDGMVKLAKIKIWYCENLLSIPKSFEGLIELTGIEFYELPNLLSVDFNFSKLQKLQKIDLSNLEKLNTINDSIKYCSSLLRVSFFRLPSLKKLPSFDANNKKLVRLDVRSCPIEIIPPTIGNIASLKELHFSGLSITSLPDTILKLNNLIGIGVNQCKHLSYIPEGIGGLPSLRRAHFYDIDPIKFRKFSNHSYNDFLEKADIITKANVFEWLFRVDRNIPPSEKMAISIFKAIIVGVKWLNEELFSELHLLNANRKAIDSEIIANGGKVFISGRMVGKKADIGLKLKELGLTLVDKLTEDVLFVLLGKKPKIVDNLYNGKRIYFTQLELESLKKEINPGMLEQADTPPDFIDKLNELILSEDLPSQLVAFEMIRNNGLPQPLEVVFLVFFHSLKSGKFKRDLKKHLKTRLSPEKIEILESRSYPFAPFKMRKVLTDQEITRLYYTEFKLMPKIRDEFFRYEPNFPHRRELFEVMLRSLSRPNNPKRFRTVATYLVKELDEILYSPAYAGKLKEAILYYPISGQASKGLLKHKATLKKLELMLDTKSNQFPPCIYELDKVEELILVMEDTIMMPDGISQMKALKQITIKNKKPLINLPKDIVDLANLTYLYVQTPSELTNSIKQKIYNR